MVLRASVIPTAEDETDAGCAALFSRFDTMGPTRAYSKPVRIEELAVGLE